MLLSRCTRSCRSRSCASHLVLFAVLVAPPVLAQEETGESTEESAEEAPAEEAPAEEAPAEEAPAEEAPAEEAPAEETPAEETPEEKTPAEETPAEETPATPVVPATPVAPATPAVPETPPAPKTPADPEAPATPEPPGTPETSPAPPVPTPAPQPSALDLLADPEEAAAEAPATEEATAPEEETPWSKDFHVDGEYRFRVIHLDRFPLDAAGTEFDQSDYAEQRLRFKPWVELSEDFSVTVEFDVFHGLTGGDINGLGLDIPRGGYAIEDFVLRPRNHLDGFAFSEFAPRQLWVRYRSPYGELRVGQMASSWGLGIVANGGDRELDFGDAYDGDLSERLLFATKPALLLTDAPWANNLVFALGGGVVFQDDHGRLLDGDVAYEGLGALRYEFDERSRVGLYVAYRHLEQDSPAGEGGRRDTLAVWALDLSGSLGLELEAIGARLTAEIELVLVVGETDMTRNLQAVEGLDVLQFGGALEATLDFEVVAVRVLAGVASGDDDPYDGTLNNFHFDPNYGVGLLMFREVLAWQSARSAILLTDPDLAGYPPEGVHLLPTQGSVTNAGYLMPEVLLRPVADLEIRVGLLWAQALRDLVDPYNTTKHQGGAAVTYLGGSGGREYGLELDSRITYTFDLADLVDIKLRLGLEQASFFPGAAFEQTDGQDMRPVHLLRGRAELIW